MRLVPTLRFAYQPDILEWAETNKSTLQSIVREKQAAKAPLFSIRKYFGSEDESAKKSIESVQSTEPETVPEPAQPEPKLGESLMQQYYQSQELRNLLKWKRVTWEKGVDYDNFSSRLIEVGKAFSKRRAFSFLSVHITRDEAARQVSERFGQPDEPFVPPPLHDIAKGTLSAWYVADVAAKAPTAANQESQKKTQYARPAPFSLCWETGNVKMLESISAQEVTYFLDHFAPRAQQTQMRIENEQTNMHEALENVRFRCTLDAVKFNEEDQAIRAESAAPPTTASPLSPEHVLQFCQSMLKTAWLYRKFFRGHQVRIGAPGSAYAIDRKAGVLHIPCDFDRYTWMAAHQKYLRHEAIANSYRNHWYVWLFVATFLVGDLDIV